MITLFVHYRNLISPLCGWSSSHRAALTWARPSIREPRRGWRGAACCRVPLWADAIVTKKMANGSPWEFTLLRTSMTSNTTMEPLVDVGDEAKAQQWRYEEPCISGSRLFCLRSRSEDGRFKLKDWISEWPRLFSKSSTYNTVCEWARPPQHVGGK